MHELNDQGQLLLDHCRFDRLAIPGKSAGKKTHNETGGKHMKVPRLIKQKISKNGILVTGAGCSL